jgi:hypothetical protein|tara:strand:- start:91 stop:993 length:903 start_codon:yes stop_codon:yes gene_type:complete
MAEAEQLEQEVTEAEVTEVEVTEEPRIQSESFSAPSEPEESEQEQEVKGAQKRINQLTKKMRDAEKREKEAVRVAQQIQNESTQLKARMQQLDNGYIEQFGKSLEIETNQAEATLKRAIEVGDSDGIITAQRQLYELSGRSQQLQAAQRQKKQEAEAAQWQAQNPQAAQQQQIAQQQALQQPQQVRRPDAKAEDWATRNAWFGQDEAMTFAAFGIHKRLVEDEGFDPQEDTYYTELDRRLQTEFPQKLGSSKRPAQTVAGVSRANNASGRSRRVKLTQTQVAIAKKLGVPLEEYAKYVKD